MLLQELNRTTSVNATAKNGDFTYNVNYSIESGNLSRLHCSVSQTVKTPIEVPEGEIQYSEQETYLGHIVNESGNKQIVLKEDVDMIPHVEFFNKILAEVKKTK